MQTLMASLVGPSASLRMESVTLSLSTSLRILANLASKSFIMPSVALSRPCRTQGLMHEDLLMTPLKQRWHWQPHSLA